MIAAQAFFTRNGGGVRGDQTQDNWYRFGFKHTDLKIIQFSQDNPEDVDFVLSGRAPFLDEQTAKEMLDYLEKRPNCKLILIEGGRFPDYHIPVNSMRRAVLNKVKLFLHNSEFQPDDEKALKAALKPSQIKMVNLNVFEPSFTDPVPLKDRLPNVFMFGAVDEYKGTIDYWKAFETYKNGKYAFGSAGSISPFLSLPGAYVVEAQMNQTLDKDKFNFIGAYEKGCRWIEWFLPHTRFALFGWKPRPCMIEAPEYAFLECIERGVPVVVRKDWLDSIRVFGEKPDIENSGIIAIEDWSDLKNLDKYEKNYEKIIQKQRAFLEKWWGKTVAENLVELFSNA